MEPLAQLGSSFGRFGEDGDAFIGPARDLMFGEVVGQDDVRQFVDQQFVDASRVVGAEMQAAQPHFSVAHFQIGEAPGLGGEASQALELFAGRVQKQIALEGPRGVAGRAEPAFAQRLASSFTQWGQSFGHGGLADVVNPKRPRLDHLPTVRMGRANAAADGVFAVAGQFPGSAIGGMPGKSDESNRRDQNGKACLKPGGRHTLCFLRRTDAVG